MRTPVPAFPDLFFELPLWQAGLLAAGLDEAGRGAWAGPVSAAAVILPPDADILEKLHGVRDSKQLAPHLRQRWAEQVRQTALAWAVGWADHLEIDELGILPATRLAMQRALEQLNARPGHLLLDALKLPAVELPQTGIIHGDARCLSIAAASLLAKTARDAWMTEAGEEYPAYGFARHKGYGTARHRQALDEVGICPIHRLTYRPVAERVNRSHHD